MAISRLNGRKIINKEKTLEFCNINTDSLSPNSLKMVWANCSSCGEELYTKYTYIKYRHYCSPIKDNQMICSKCGIYKNFCDFFKATNFSTGLSPECKLCYKSKEVNGPYHARRKERRKRASIDNIELYCRSIIGSIKTRQTGVLDFDSAFLVDLWNKQKGLCYYSGLPMQKKDFKDKTPEWRSPSIDKLIPSLGYTRNNIVWCCFAINSFKSSTSSDEFIQKINNIRWSFLMDQQEEYNI